MNKWKHKHTGRIVEVLGDEGLKRFYAWTDDSKQEICEWNFVYNGAWEDSFSPAENQAAA